MFLSLVQCCTVRFVRTSRGKQVHLLIFTLSAENEARKCTRIDAHERDKVKLVVLETFSFRSG